MNNFPQWLKAQNKKARRRFYWHDYIELIGTLTFFLVCGGVGAAFVFLFGRVGK